MAFESLLVHNLYAYRRPASSVDRYGQPVEASLTTAHFSGKCRYSSKMGGKQNNERAEEQFEDMYVVFLVGNPDIREDDLIVIKDNSGNTLVPSARVQTRYDVYGSTSSSHHVELTVWTQQGAGNGPGL